MNAGFRIAFAAAFLFLAGVTPAWASVPTVQAPEPGTIALFGSGVAGLFVLKAFLRRR